MERLLPVVGAVLVGVTFVAPASAADSQAPSVPGSFRSAGVFPTAAYLAWTASTDNVGVTGYRLTRTNNDGGGVVVTDLPASTSYQATGLNTGWTYRFRLQARDAAGNFSAVTAPDVVVLTAYPDATASSTFNATYDPRYAIDGSTATRWASAQGQAGPWLNVDYGPAGKSVGHVKVNWEAAYAPTYVIETSNDGAAWTTRKTETVACGCVKDSYFAAATVRYVRIRATSLGQFNLASTWEVTTDAASDPGGGTPSGEAMPVGDLAGWHQIFTDDFTQNVALGQFPAAVAAKWWAYPWPWTGTPTWAKYNPERTTSFHDGMMDMWMHDEVINGVTEHLITAPVPRINGPDPASADQLYGRYAIRYRSDSTPHYHASFLLWPQSGVWPRDGEIDFPEAEFNGNVNAFMHRQGGTSGGDQDAYPTNVPWAGAWHTAVTEWLPTRVTFWLDGVKIGESTSRIPNTSMHWVIQNGGSFAVGTPATTTPAHVLVDWIAAYARSAP